MPDGQEVDWYYDRVQPPSPGHAEQMSSRGAVVTC